MRNRCLIILSIHILKLEISGCDRESGECPAAAGESTSDPVLPPDGEHIKLPSVFS
jgi:hypothetical protein